LSDFGSVTSSEQKARVDVLLVDDSVSDLRLLLEMLALRDAKVSIALDGEQGYQQAVQLLPRLILLDVRMPGASGFDLCRRLKVNHLTRPIPVIFLTAANDLEERLEGFAAGGVDYIGKPFEVQEVLARIGVHLVISEPAGNAFLSVANGRSETYDSPDELLVSAAQRILKDAIADPPDLEKLSLLLRVNRRRLNDAFQTMCGQPVFGWFREERLRQAYFLVSQTATPFITIAESLGYSTAANFSKAFRLRYDFAPGEVRAATAGNGTHASDRSDED
jgi:DNA-binding response OmpR family regulator